MPLNCHSRLVIATLGAVALVACGKDKNSSGKSANLPMLTPPVEAATPAGLRGQASLALTLPAGEFSQRFFAAAGGPTNVFRILTEIDQRISDINSQTGGKDSACVTQEPVAYSLTPFGQSVAFYAQCSQVLPAGPASATAGLIQFGVKDGITYIYTSIGAGQVGAIATPIAGANAYSVQAWISVGVGNAPTWDAGSYAVMALAADESSHALEFSVAGIGVGYCGAQLRSDGTSVYATGSSDMSATCNAVDTLCVAAATGAAATTCAAPLTSFTLPAIGRRAATGAHASGASLYPAAPNITFDGTATDATHFGPTTPTPGVGTL